MSDIAFDTIVNCVLFLVSPAVIVTLELLLTIGCDDVDAPLDLVTVFLLFSISSLVFWFRDNCSVILPPSLLLLALILFGALSKSVLENELLVFLKFCSKEDWLQCFLLVIYTH